MSRRLLLVAAATSLFIVGLILNTPKTTLAQSGPAQCQQNTPLGSTPPGDCPDYSGVQGAPTLTPGKCYIVTLATTITAEEKPCDGFPFAKNYTSAACKDGTFQGASNKTAEELCKDHGGVGQPDLATCVDGTTEQIIAPKTAETICKDHGGTKKAQEEKQNQNNASAGKTSEALKNPTREKVQSCDGEACITENPLVVIVKAIVNFVSVIVAVIVVIMIIVGGIQYASAGGNPNKVAEAKNRITNAILAFVMYIFLFAFLQWLIPGGVLK